MIIFIIQERYGFSRLFDIILAVDD